MGKLPGWAKSKIEEERSGAGAKPSSAPGASRSRWGARGPASFSPLSSEFQPPDDDSQKDPSSLEYPRTPLMVGEDDTSLSEMEHSMSPHPRAGQAHSVSFKRPETVDSYNDADVDDYSTQDDGGESTEPESAQGHTMYFGQDEEGSDKYQVSQHPRVTTLVQINKLCCQVNAMDVEELRRSQRRYRAGRGRGHGDGSDEEDDDLGSSTPGAESSDKNIHSMLCVR